MTFIGRLVGCLSALVLTCSMLSCGDSAKQSPVAPSQTAGTARATPTFDANEVDLAEATALVDDISAAVGKPGSVAIVVKEKTTGVSGVTVTVTCPGGFTKIGKTKAGKVTITGVPPSPPKCQVTVTHTDYSTQQPKTVTVQSGKTASATFAIVKKPAPQPGQNCAKTLHEDQKICDGLYPIIQWGGEKHRGCYAIAACNSGWCTRRVVDKGCQAGRQEPS